MILTGRLFQFAPSSAFLLVYTVISLVGSLLIFLPWISMLYVQKIILVLICLQDVSRLEDRSGSSNSMGRLALVPMGKQNGINHM